MVRAGSLHLSWHQRLLVHASGWLLLASGVVWLGVHYLAGAGELPHPLEAWMMRAHALAAWVAAFALGEIAASHIPRGWHTTMRRRTPAQRRLGLALCVMALAPGVDRLRVDVPGARTLACDVGLGAQRGRRG